ncbi:tetratricopeptide repeat protein [Lentzea sp. NPDC058450]|uniref:tetratricopeptide repeat protein n=1 Tax=Lentzea sp. NPDC058450 TaxID=3346505 RepID=UPI003653E39A
MIERSVLGSVDHSQVVLGDHNIVNVTADRPPIKVRSPRRRASVQHLLFGPDTGHHATDRPLTWLRPDAGVVPVQPRPEDTDLLSWCTDGSPMRVRLVCGRGGQGKTTTALQLVKALRAGKHIAGFLDLSFAEGTESDLSRLRWAEIDAALHSRPAQKTTTLLVVDYAENAPLSLHRLLVTIRTAPTVRVLLLSRSEGNWWPELLADPTWSLLIEPEPTRLDSLTTHLPADELHADAVQRFAARLPTPTPTADDTAREFATTLDLYADALLRVLDAAAVHRGEPPVRTSGNDPISDLLAHESRHVKSLLADHQIDLSPHDRDLLLAAPFLVPAPTLDDAVRLLRTLDLEGDHDDAWFRRTAKVLGKLYPGDQAVWAAPRPDRLPDSHLLGLAERAASDGDWTDLASRLCATDDQEVAEHISKVLSRCLSTPGADRRFEAGIRRLLGTMDSLVRRHPKGYLLPTILLSPGRFTDALAAVLADPEALPTADVEAADWVLRSLGPSTSRAVDVVHLSQRLAEDTALRPDAYDVEILRHAQVLTYLSIRLAGIGQREQAVAPARRAVELHQQLADGNPEVHLPDLARSFHNFAIRLGAVGRHEPALIPARRAVEIWKQLAATDPGTYTLRHAESLGNLASRLGNLGQHEQALTFARHAVEMQERLAEAAPDVHLPHLATSLTNLASHLAEMGHREQALVPAERAVTMVERLAEVNPDSYLPDLAMALNNLSNRLAAAGRSEQALVAVERATEIRERLTDANAAAWLPDLAVALNNLAVRRAEAGQPEESLVSARRAVEILEQLAEASPDAYVPDLARSLSNLGVQLQEAGNREEALVPTLRAVHLIQKLADANPDAYLPTLAIALSNASYHLASLDQLEQALTHVQRAVTILDLVAAANPEAHLESLAYALGNQSDYLAAMGLFEKSISPAEREVEIFQKLCEAHINLFLPRLADALSILASRSAETGQNERVVAPILRAVALVRQHDDDGLDADLRVLGTSLRTLADLDEAAAAEDVQRRVERLT